jgi:Viral BACON domain/Putative binding domain, N-terminal
MNLRGTAVGGFAGAMAALAVGSLVYLGCTTSTLTSTNPSPVKCQVTAAGAPPMTASGGMTFVQVSAQPECAWTAVADATWITQLKPAAGQGNGQIEVDVSANAARSSRQGNVKVNDSVVPIVQEGTPCQFIVTAPDVPVGPAGGTFTITVTTTSGCAWTLESFPAWLTPVSSTTGTGSGSVGFSVAANTSAARSGSITVAGQSVTVSQAPATGCDAIVDPLSLTVAGSGGPLGLTITTPSTCSWTATSPVSWITVSPVSGVGRGTVTLAAAANSGAPRTATLTVAGQLVTVTQGAVNCSYAISPTSLLAPAAGGSFPVSVTAGAACLWTATPDASWITITGGPSGTGNGSVSFSVAANTGPARTGTIHIADKEFAVTQAAPPAQCTFALSATAQTLPANAGAGASVSVTTTSDCAWTASSNVPWITITSPSSTTGNGIVSFSVTANPGAQRTGTLTIAGQTHTVTQSAAVTCTYAINPTSQTVASGGGAGTAIAVTATAGCAWTATSNAAWLTITSAAGGTGNGTVTFTAAVNPGTQRTGTLTIAGQTHTVTQSAAVTCTYAINPTSQTVAGGGGAGTAIAVTATAGCAWTAVSNVTWITVTAGAIGVGNGTVAFSVAANSLTVDRSGTITIASKTFTVDQKKR